ncbi:hypothetical protein DLAC_09037 [Tieghemostelium lacteum]|uniref:NAD-dependent epimerase/dehydratase domain-containing protein n=1 Tax=Tieghemostelium lacteum TaxID=361077 RepID=A0A151Z8Z1_TIELA|nr:hypothetical protein DLAC_09037 [Tieghemostelium lacteum]|eukprot:KYQ90418.1 hypothetical protein DLAC_09037 [Tieghemostelium lacteum]
MQQQYKILIFGGNGWIGGKIINLLKDNKEIEFECSQSRLENRSDIEKDIDKFQPTMIINCAGVTGRPNVDWCEDHKIETIRSNVIGTLNLVDIASQHKIHVTNFATGCIYQYDQQHPMGSGISFNEEDPYNYDGSFYSKTKAMVETLLKCYDNVLTLRLRMPISDHITNEPRNFISKIIKYQRVVNIPNSMSILYDLLPISIDMTLKGYKGIYNFVNPGVISHNEILNLYKNEIDQNFTYENFSEEEQSKILKAGRSNNQLDTKKLQLLYPNLDNIQVSIQKLFQRMKSFENVNNK